MINSKIVDEKTAKCIDSQCGKNKSKSRSMAPKTQIYMTGIHSAVIRKFPLEIE